MTDSTTKPMNFLHLIVKVCCSDSVNLSLHMMPIVGEEPPMPRSEASENDWSVGLRKTIRLREIPSSAGARNWSHRRRSAFAAAGRVAGVLFAFAINSILRR